MEIDFSKVVGTMYNVCRQQKFERQPPARTRTVVTTTDKLYKFRSSYHYWLKVKQ